MNTTTKFDGRAKDYAAGRPTYSAELVCWLRGAGIEKSSVIADVARVRANSRNACSTRAVRFSPSSRIPICVRLPKPICAEIPISFRSAAARKTRLFPAEAWISLRQLRLFIGLTEQNSDANVCVYSKKRKGFSDLEFSGARRPSKPRMERNRFPILSGFQRFRKRNPPRRRKNKSLLRRKIRLCGF